MRVSSSAVSYASTNGCVPSSDPMSDRALHNGSLSPGRFCTNRAHMASAKPEAVLRLSLKAEAVAIPSRGLDTLVVLQPFQMTG